MSTKSYTEAELIEVFNLPCSNILDFFDKYECKRVVIGYPSISHVIYGYNNPEYLPDIAHLIDYGVGKTVIISSYETGSPRYQVYNFLIGGRLLILLMKLNIRCLCLLIVS